MSHFECTELEEGLSQRGSTEQHLSLADVTGTVLVLRTPVATAVTCSKIEMVSPIQSGSEMAPHTIRVLIRFRAILGKVDSRAKHSANVCVPLVESLLHDRIDKG